MFPRLRKIVDFNEEEKKISLSLKALLNANEEAEKEEAPETAEEPEAEAAEAVEETAEVEAPKAEVAEETAGKQQ